MNSFYNYNSEIFLKCLKGRRNKLITIGKSTVIINKTSNKLESRKIVIIYVPIIDPKAIAALTIPIDCDLLFIATFSVISPKYDISIIGHIGRTHKITMKKFFANRRNNPK